MAQMDYLDFDLQIERSGDNYCARVLDSPAGQASIEFSLPFSDLEIENFLLRAGRTRRGVRRLQSPEIEAAKNFGGTLFQAIFDRDVKTCLADSLTAAQQQGAGLRLRLRFAGTPELFDLPWEYLHNPALNRFISLSNETPLVRYIDLPEKIKPLEVRPPLKVLVMIASPGDYPTLDVAEEWTRLKASLRDLEQRGLVVIERLETASLAALQRQLRQGEYHIFHFIGHGMFDQQTQDGVLLLEDERGRGRAVSGQYLGTLLHDARTLRLAILNACEGARTSRSDPFAGAAQSLVQQGVPAVIAMQFEITDQAAITLSREFYAALADGYPVDAALVEARKAIFAQGNDIEWGTPVLYLRAPDGRIFDVSQQAERPAARAIEAPSPESTSPAKTTVSRRRLPKWAWAVTAGALVVAIILLASTLPSLFAGKVASHTPTVTSEQAVTNTPTTTSAPVSSGSPALYDDFNNPDYAGSFDPFRWTYFTASPNKAFQQDGVLVITQGKEKPYEITRLVALDYSDYILNAPTFFEAKVRLSPEEHAGVAEIVLLATLSDSTEWYAACVLSETLANCMDALLPSGDNTYEAGGVPHAYGNWYTLRIEIDPATMMLTYQVDGQRIGMHIPADAAALKGVKFNFALGVLGESDSGTVTASFDDVSAGPIK